METAHPKPVSGQTQAPRSLGPQELTRTSCCGQPSSPEIPCLLPFTRVPITVASGTLQPGLHHHALLHPLPAGKSSAAGWPLSTGFVLLHEMNCCGVGVGEAGCRERSRGSGRLGVPGFAHGDGGGSSQQLSSLPTRLSLPATAVPPGLDSALPPRRATAALAVPQTPPAPSSCTFASSHPLGFVPMSSQCQSQSPGSEGGFGLGEEDARPLKSHRHLHPNLSGAIHSAWQTRCPAGSGMTKTDLFRANKYIKARRK